MKVLFAVSNENISESIVKKYQKEYKEIISYKNVYYFNAILKEIQRDKTYDRIVISEDLEPFANNDYETIDKFIFDKLDSISDEATDVEGKETEIILICSDRRAKSESLLVKLFGIGIYNALLGSDRSIEQVCNLLNKPRSKKEAKIYYKIESDDVNYQAENEDSVSEAEIQSIRAHYKKLGKNEDAYVEAFNSIAAQYTDAQLKLIIKFLPLNVKAVLESNSPKYQSLTSFSGGTYSAATKATTKRQEPLKIDFIESQLDKPKLTKPVVVPSAVNTENVKKLGKKKDKVAEDTNIDNEQPVEETMPKRRGRPRKVTTEETTSVETENAPKRGRGRPRKNIENEENTQNTNEEPIDLFALDNEMDTGIEDSNNDIENKLDNILPGFEDDEIEANEVKENTVLPGIEEENDDTTYDEEPIYNNLTNTSNNIETNFNIDNLLTKDKKIVSFVGTTKNGTSFLVNNVAKILSDMGINTAILDATKNKNSYYIYTKNEEELRKIAYSCVNNLNNGVADGIKVNNNLTVYTSLPTEEDNMNYQNVLSTLLKQHSLILIDCDFHTPYEYFANSQEIYLVQSMDILTIQPLTAFLRELKAKNVLAQEKIRVVINKDSKIRSLNPKVIIGGMAYYNDPAMSFMTELFNKDSVKYCTIPLDMLVYNKYLEGLVNCKISLNGYPKNFMNSLKELSNMVYPLITNKYKQVTSYQPNSTFSTSTNNTLEQMKKKF